nr:odorant binding protein [Semanotus bifasciatus]
MKFLLLVSLIFAVSNALDKEFVEKMKMKMQEVGAECVEKEKPNEDDIGLLIAHQMPTTHEGKCVIYCVYKYFNTINEDATINVEGGIEALQPLKENDEELYEKVAAILKKCTSSLTIDGDPCNTGAKLIECTVLEAKAMGLSEEMLDM